MKASSRQGLPPSHPLSPSLPLLLLFSHLFSIQVKVPPEVLINELPLPPRDLRYYIFDCIVHLDLLRDFVLDVLCLSLHDLPRHGGGEEEAGVGESVPPTLGTGAGDQGAEAGDEAEVEGCYGAVLLAGLNGVKEGHGRSPVTAGNVAIESYGLGSVVVAEVKEDSYELV